MRNFLLSVHIHSFNFTYRIASQKHTRTLYLTFHSTSPHSPPRSYFSLNPWIQVDQNCIGPRFLWELREGEGNRIQSQITTVHRSPRPLGLMRSMSMRHCLPVHGWGEGAFPLSFVFFRTRSAEFRFKWIVPLSFSHFHASAIRGLPPRFPNHSRVWTVNNVWPPRDFDLVSYFYVSEFIRVINILMLKTRRKIGKI